MIRMAFRIKKTNYKSEFCERFSDPCRKSIGDLISFLCISWSETVDALGKFKTGKSPSSDIHPENMNHITLGSEKPAYRLRLLFNDFIQHGTVVTDCLLGTTVNLRLN